MFPFLFSFKCQKVEMIDLRMFFFSYIIEAFKSISQTYFSKLSTNNDPVFEQMEFCLVPKSIRIVFLQSKLVLI